MDNLSADGIYLAVFIAAGLAWSLSGFINGLRAHANYLQMHTGNVPPDPDWQGFQPAKTRDDIFIGLILGVVAFLTAAASGTPNITTLQAFITAVIAATGAIGLTDKIFVGGILNK